MITGNRVLVVVDPTRVDEQTCVTRGTWLAEKLGVGLELLICDYKQYQSGDRIGDLDVDSATTSTLREKVVEDNREKLEKIATPLRRQGHDVIVTSICDAPLDVGIIRHVLRTSPKIVIKETHYHKRIGRALFGNTDWNLVRQCPEPLWLAKQQPWPPEAAILASVDPTHVDDKHSDLDDQILNLATILADKLDSDMHVFHSFLSPASMPVIEFESGGFYDGDIDKAMEEAQQKSVDEALEGFPVSAEHVHLMSGYPDQLLPALARKIDAGLVVMGSIARNALQRIFIGSTTEKVLDKLPCDLLVLKPLWFECQIPIRLEKHPAGYASERDVGAGNDSDKMNPV